MAAVGVGGHFDTTFLDICRTFKRLIIQFWNFLTFPKYLKQIFWKNLNYNFLLQPPSEGVLKKWKFLELVVEP